MAHATAEQQRSPSDGGLLAYRELDDAFGLTAMAVSISSEGQRGRNIHHRLLALLQQPVYGRLAGYEDVNDHHPLFVSNQLGDLERSMPRPATCTAPKAGVWCWSR